MSQDFNYSPLMEPDSIRLIDLKPSPSYTARIQCSLIHTTLSAGDTQDVFNHYAALSYVWGSAQKFEVIWIDEKPLKVTASLFSALRDLRDETRPFFLWADGICINQNDDEEKAMQVQLMSRIYSEASNTIIYLGPSAQHSNECRYLLSVRRDIVTHDPDAVDAISSIFRGEWFERVWVFQELVLATNPWLQCGRTRAKWTAVLQNGLGLLPNGIPRNAFQMQQAWLAYQASRNKSSSLLDLVQARRGLGVSDPRDMVFAHVGLAVDGDDLVVDYSKSCAQVFTDFAVHTGNKHGFIKLLDLVWESTYPPRVRMQDLPSWVSDLTTPSPTLRLPVREDITDGFGEKTSWLPIGQVLAFIRKQCHKIDAITSELSLSRVPAHTRKAISAKLERFQLEFVEPQNIYRLKSWIYSRYFDMLKAT